MNDLTFIFYSLKSRWLNSALSILLTAFGVSIALLVMQFSNHIQNRLNTDGKGIDIVIGAKGSPLQLILSSIYHVDLPNGNISFDSIKKFINHPQVDTVIPLALGDNWNGYRIVGTSKEYLKHYKAELSKGSGWKKKFDVVIGSSVGKKINDKFYGSHGLLKGGNSHENSVYTVTGILKPTGTVLDRLILTSIDSVLHIHGQKNINHNDEGHNEDNHDNHKKDEHDHHEKDEHDHHEGKNNHIDNSKSPEITALLVKTKSPIANINLARQINRESALLAANPSLEITRLTSMFGLGSKSFGILSTILIIISTLGIFSGLASNLQNRIGDLAILRAIGYSKKRIFKIITLEGVFISFAGIIFGIIVGILIFNILTKTITPLEITKANFKFTLEFFLITFFILLAGIVAAIFPAYHGSKISVAEQLSRNI